ncbi:hypothetical protein PT974_02459 [Cladobotryum mycophilum]|uniref:Myb-like DNA-binding domain-containing protein n=1 Tax=Cladobotryum mycophilum TaxID=491253 RepID=A0ABR0SY65_9HYPO
MPGETPKKEPTASEAMFFYAIVKHTRNKADIDWNAVAEEQGFKNAEVAKVRFGQVKRKLGIAGDATTTPKKAGATSAGPTPTKVTKNTGRAGTKGRGGGRGRVKKEEPVDDVDDDESKTVSSPVKGETPEGEEKLGIDAVMNDDDPF